MDIHEYQGKRLLQQFQVPVPVGDVAYNTHEALRIARWLEEDVMVVKAQVRAGGRGKAGGIKLARSVQEVVTAADVMFGSYLKTPQTPPQGLQVRRVYIEAGCDIASEFYACVIINRKTGGNDVIVSAAGGMDIEKAAAASPDAMERVSLPPGETMQMHHARMLCYKLGLRGKSGRRVQRALLNIYRAYDTLDATLIEVNPLVVTKSGEVMALDCKASFDDNALYRQRWAEEMRDDDDADPLELEAAQHNLNYVKLKGNIGIMVNGAGLSMATMDIISHMGGAAANFMDVAGAATPERVAAAFKLIYRDQDVKGILLNIFGGMMRCNSIAEGLVSAAREVGLSKPLVVRLEGTNVELGRKILNESGLPINPVATMGEAARRIVDAVREAS